MASKQFILYDLASKAPQSSWSLNPWKTRLNLNYKKLDYKTIWVDYPDLKPILAPHFKQELDLYTAPTLAFPNGEYVADSWNIAQKLEREHPEPSLHLDSPYVAKIQDQMPKVMGHIKTITASTVPRTLLREASLDYWRKTREERIGMTLEKAQAEGTGLKTWQKAEADIKQVTEWLKENEGPFFAGSELSFADFVWVGFLLFWQRVGDGNYEHFKTVVGADITAHEKLLEAVKPWSERNDH